MNLHYNMKPIDMNQPMLEIDGTTAMQNIYDKNDTEFQNKNGFQKVIGQKPFILKDAVIGCLNHVSQGQSPEDSFKAGMLIVKVNKSSLETEYESEEITLIKKKAKEVLPPQTMIAVCELIEGKENPYKQ